MSILIVDDDEDTLELLALMLSREGWTVDSATSVKEARRALRETGYRVLITDLHLPDGRATELLAGPFKRPLRGTILVTGADTQTEPALGDAFKIRLVKPVTSSQLLAAVTPLVEDCSEAP